jgi:hypothetical protein
MGMNWFKVAAIGAGLLAPGGMASASIIYNDGGTLTTGPYRGIEDVSIDFKIDTDRTAISLDLLGRKTIDGLNDFEDDFSLIVNGYMVYSATFNLGGGGDNYEYVNTYSDPYFDFAYTVTNFGNGIGGVAAITGMIYGLDIGINNLTVRFTSPGLGNGTNGQGTDDESWALNNVDLAAVVSTVPLPAGMPLLAAALAGLGLMGASRRKSKRS